MKNERSLKKMAVRLDLILISNWQLKKIVHTVDSTSPNKNSRLSSCRCAKACRSSSVRKLSSLFSKTVLMTEIAVEPAVARHESLTRCMACNFCKYHDM
jgi:hypothetical protein